MEPSFTRIFIASVKFLARLAIAAKQIRLSRVDQRIPVRAEIFFSVIKQRREHLVLLKEQI